MNITLIKINFTDALKNQSSKEFQTLSKRFVEGLTRVYKNTTGFERIEVTGFAPGSVKVSFRVIIVVKIDNPKAKVKQSEAKANATNRIIKQVKNNDGELGSGLIVKKDSIQTDAPPNPPRNVTVRDVKETTAHLTWTKPEYAELFAVTHYAVQLKQHGDKFKWDEKVTTSYVQLDCPLENLQDGTGYNVKVVAKRDATYGLGSKQTEFKTDSKKILLLWLWILIAVVVVLGIAVIGILWCRYRKRKTDGSCGRDKNANETQGDRTRMYQSDIRLNSYKNLAFSLPSLDYDSLGIMPGKWWEIPRESLTFGEVLGSGAFGLVRKAQLDTGDRFVTCAVKMLKKMASDEDQRDLIQELEIMGGVGSHSNLVNLIGACTKNGPFMIVLEFAEKGSLLDYLKLNTTNVNGDQVSSLADEVKLNIALDIAKGMQHLSNVKCVHRDLASRNVLLTELGQAKISDFGLSRDVYERGFYEKKSQGKLPVRWMAPEAITKMLFTTQSDVWSYGVVLWEVETGGKVPYAGIGGLELVNHLNKGYRLQQPASCMDDVYNIMTECWYINPDERPNFDEICYKLEALLSHQHSVLSP